MSKSTHQINIRAVDKTGGAFTSIRARAAVASASMRKMLGGALAGVGAYMGLRSMKSAVDELGKLSDLSMKTGTSVAELTSSVTAFQTMGLDIPVERLAKSFQYLNKTTGKSGMAGFKDALMSIAKIEDPLKRGAKLTQIFGDAGLELLPLIDGGEKAVKAFTDLADLMPRIGDAAANSGDAVADSLNILTTGGKSMWMNFIGYLCSLWSDDFPGGIRAGALNAYNVLETFFKKCGARINWLGTNFLSFGALIGDVFKMGPKAAWDLYMQTNDVAGREFDSTMADIDAKRAAYVEKLKNANADALANALGGKNRGGAGADAAGGSSIPKVRNDLIMAGTATSNKLAALGPQLQTDAKKQTALLEDIAETNRKALEAQEEHDTMHLEVM